MKSYVAAFDPRLGYVNTVAPKVSIVVTNYNYANYVSDCLRSVSAQQYPEIECVVVDDCSADDSVEKLTQFIETQRSHVAFKLFTHESTRGQYAAFRTGLAHTDGAFVVFLDADDLILPNFVDEHLRVHLSYPPVAFTSSNQYQIDSVGQIIGGIHPDLHTRDKHRAVVTVSLHQPFWVWATTSSMMFRRSVLDYVLSDADDAFRKCADNFVCHFCNMLGGSILVPVVLGCYRRHQLNTFSTNPLIGGRLPTGDMRNHPSHKAVLSHVGEHLLERSQPFIALLGVQGFLYALSKVTPLKNLGRNIRALDKISGLGGSYKLRCLQIFLSLRLRRIIRVIRNRHPSVTIHDLEDVGRAETHPPL